MINRDEFAPEEWQALLAAPSMAAMYVSLASPSGPLGVIKEAIAVPKLVLAASDAGTGNALVDAVADDFRQHGVDAHKKATSGLSRDYETLKSQCLEACRSAASLVDTKAPAEAAGFKRWIYQAAQQSAEAAKEGGFLGFGGVRVSEQEYAALKEIATALDIPV